jgi:hypothetical protein
MKPFAMTRMPSPLPTVAAARPAGLADLLGALGARSYRTSQTLSPDSRSKGPGSAAAALADTIQLSPDARAKHDAAQETLAQLQQMHSAMASDRKGAAKQKLDQAKAKLQMLRMFSGDPKALARQAKQIAQEIREAAKDYAAAGAMEASAGTEAPASAMAGMTVTPGNDSAGDTQATTGTDDKPSGTAAESGGEDTGKTVKDVSRAEEPPTNEERRQQVADAYRAAAHDIASRGAKAQAEREEIEQFKDAARQARELLREAARRLKQAKAEPGEIEELEKASRSMTRAVDDLAAPDTTGADAAAAPVLNLLA